MSNFFSTVKAIADKNRIRVVLALMHSPMCVCQLTSLLELAPSTTSTHIKILEKAKIIKGIRKGKWVFYELSTPKNNPFILQIKSLLLSGSKEVKELSEDIKKIEKILGEYCQIHNEFHKI